MALHPGNIQWYTYEIQIAGSDAAIGHNPGIIEAEPIHSKGDKAFPGKIASPAGTRVSAADSDGKSVEKRQSATAHEEKTALVPLWPCGALVIVSLAVPSSHEKQGPQRHGQCPQKWQSFPTCLGTKRPECCSVRGESFEPLCDPGHRRCRRLIPHRRYISRVRHGHSARAGPNDTQAALRSCNTGYCGTGR